MWCFAIVLCFAMMLSGCSSSSDEADTARGGGAGKGASGSAGTATGGAAGGGGSGANGSGAGRGGAGPGGNAGTAGSGASVTAQAQELCEKLLAAGCVVGTQEECEKGINDTFALAVTTDCVTEFNTLLACRNQGALTCDSQGNLQSPRCLEETQAVNTCVAG